MIHIVTNKEQLDIILEALDCLETMDSMGYPRLGKDKIDEVRQQLKSAKDITSPVISWNDALGQTRN